MLRIYRIKCFVMHHDDDFCCFFKLDLKATVKFNRIFFLVVIIMILAVGFDDFCMYYTSVL